MPDIAVVTFNTLPRYNPTAKYDTLGPLGVANRRAWCERHGLPFYADAPPAPGRPACWAKFNAVATALARHDWVLWADSDALVADPARGPTAFCRPGADIVSQSLDPIADRLGVPRARLRDHQPVNTGVILFRSSEWTRALLDRARTRTEFAQPPSEAPDHVWDGIGDQEALIAALAETEDAEAHIARVPDLQAPPALYPGSGALFVHFFGNHGAHRVPPEICAKVTARWARAASAGGPLPSDMALFHWCAIQMRVQNALFDRGGPERFLYDAEALGVPPICTE